MKLHNRFALLALVAGLAFSCSKDKDVPQPPVPDPDPVPGCMDPTSMNYNPLATVDDGSCQYPTVYMPLKEGNSWLLTDQITLPVIGTTLDVTQTITVGRDSLILGSTYHQVTMKTNVGGIFDIQDEVWWYSLGATGKLWRIADGDTIKNCFITYPLELGTQWYSTDVVPDFQYRMISSTYEMDVPAGTFNNVMGIEVTDLNSNMVSTMYVAKDAGMLKNTMEFSFGGTELVIEPELESVTLVP